MEEICIGNEHLILCEGKLKTDKTLAQTNYLLKKTSKIFVRLLYTNNGELWSLVHVTSNQSRTVNYSE